MMRMDLWTRCAVALLALGAVGLTACEQEPHEPELPPPPAMEEPTRDAPATEQPEPLPSPPAIEEDTGTPEGE